MAKIVAMLDKVLAQGVEQLRMGRRVGCAEIVGRLDQPPAHEFFPKAVDHRLGEVRILPGGDPVGEAFARIALGLEELRREAAAGRPCRSWDG